MTICMFVNIICAKIYHTFISLSISRKKKERKQGTKRGSIFQRFVQKE